MNRGFYHYIKYYVLHKYYRTIQPSTFTLMMRSFYQKVILAALLLLQCYAGYGQATDLVVQGRVTDSETNESLPGVSILLKGTSQGTITDAEGRYSLKV